MDLLIPTYFSPVLLCLFALNTYLGYKAFKQENYFQLFLSGTFSIAISPVFAWTIGPIMFGIGIIKFFIATQNALKVRSAEK